MMNNEPGMNRNRMVGARVPIHREAGVLLQGKRRVAVGDHEDGVRRHA